MADKPKGRKGDYVGFSTLSARVRKRTNPRTGRPYTKTEADKIAAAIGRRKYGAKKMGKFAAAGRK